MKIRNGQFHKNNHSMSFNHQSLLNQMYDRVCNQQSTIQESSNIQPLLSYLSISGKNSQVQEKPASSHFHPNFVRLSCQEQGNKHSFHYPKKYSVQQRVKTDMYEKNEFTIEEIQTLRLQNELLRRNLIKCQKKIIRLQSFQSEVEYLKKLSLLQHTEIQKLRIMLRNKQIQQLENNFTNLKSIQSQSKSVKEKRMNKNGVIRVTQANNSSQNFQKKKPRYSHKSSFSRKDKENQGDQRTHSIFFQTKNKQTIDRNTKKGIFQQKISKLKNKRTIVRLD